MPTLAPEDVLAASGFVAASLTTSKRRALATVSAVWSTINPDDVLASVDTITPILVEVMHAQQAAGRVAAWSQAQLAAAVAYPERVPGTLTLPIELRDGLMASGVPFEAAMSGAGPGILSRIGAGMSPLEAIDLSGKVTASMVGSIAHDEARKTTEDVVFSDRPGVDRMKGYARRTEGAHTCNFCRMLATRGPVYRRDTAGFRAHAFCDCTVYAVSMAEFNVDPGDWDAYQEWASRRSSSPVGSAPARASLAPTRTGGVSYDQFKAATPPRLTQVETQLATFEPVVATGNATEWMRNRVQELLAERAQLLAA